jgi:hypothetical protein
MAWWLGFFSILFLIGVLFKDLNESAQRWEEQQRRRLIEDLDGLLKRRDERRAR